MLDPAVVDAVAAYIVEYRRQGGFPARMLEAVLAAFPQATGGTYALALTRANRLERSVALSVGGPR